MPSPEAAKFSCFLLVAFGVVLIVILGFVLFRLAERAGREQKRNELATGETPVLREKENDHG